MDSDKIDIHKTERAYETALESLRTDRLINARNKELILKFLWDCKVGKTVKGRAKKKIGKRRLIKYLFTLKKLSLWLGKLFDEVSQDEMERFISDLEDNVFKNRGQNYRERTKLDFKKSLIKFYKWLGRAKLLEFMDTTPVETDVPVLRRDEVEKLVNSTPDAWFKAAIMVLFDGGPRIEEMLNLRIKDLTIREYRDDARCHWINIRHSKTFGRTIPLPLCGQYLGELRRTHPLRDDPEAPLFNISYPAFRKRLRVLSMKVLAKKLTPHMMRHSSATYWAPKMNRYQLCAKYGWAFGSDMPDRYIKRKGIIFDEIAQKGDVDQFSRLQSENRALKDNLEKLEKGYQTVKKALEFVMPIIMEDPDSFKQKAIVRKLQADN